MTVQRDDYEPHAFDAGAHILAELIRRLPPDEYALAVETLRREPFSTRVELVGGGWLRVTVGNEVPMIVGKVHIGAFRRDGASAN